MYQDPYQDFESRGREAVIKFLETRPGFHDFPDDRSLQPDRLILFLRRSRRRDRNKDPENSLSVRANNRRDEASRTIQSARKSGHPMGLLRQRRWTWPIFLADNRALVKSSNISYYASRDDSNRFRVPSKSIQTTPTFLGDLLLASMKRRGKSWKN